MTSYDGEVRTSSRRRALLRRQQHFAARGQAILEAAIEVFCSDGYDGASVSAIARAAGISDGVIYKHVEGKEHLLYMAIGWRYAVVVDGVVEEVRKARGAAKRIRLFVDLHLQSWAEMPRFNLLYFHETRRAAHRYSHLVTVHSTRYVHCLESTLQDGIAAGLLKPNLDLRFIRDFIIGGLDHAVWWSGALGRPIDVPALREQAVDQIMAGIGLSPPRAQASAPRTTEELP